MRIGNVYRPLHDIVLIRIIGMIEHHGMADFMDGGAEIGTCRFAESLPSTFAPIIMVREIYMGSHRGSFPGDVVYAFNSIIVHHAKDAFIVQLPDGQ